MPTNDLPVARKHYSQAVVVVVVTYRRQNSSLGTSIPCELSLRRTNTAKSLWNLFTSLRSVAVGHFGYGTDLPDFPLWTLRSTHKSFRGKNRGNPLKNRENSSKNSNLNEKARFSPGKRVGTWESIPDVGWGGLGVRFQKVGIWEIWVSGQNSGKSIFCTLLFSAFSRDPEAFRRSLAGVKRFYECIPSKCGID